MTVNNDSQSTITGSKTVNNFTSIMTVKQLQSTMTVNNGYYSQHLQSTITVDNYRQQLQSIISVNNTVGLMIFVMATLHMLPWLKPLTAISE